MLEFIFCDSFIIEPRYRKKIFAEGVKGYTEKILSYIPELYPYIDEIKFNVQEDHVHMVVVIPPRIAFADTINIVIGLRCSQLLLGEFHPKSFKRILIGKMSKFLCALNLPESIDKNIRMLYKKMFTPEINDFRNTIESPNSKYFDDFNKIRNHVLLYAKPVLK
ncbi:hypothetical protein ES708_29359 [subsurface metagenome]